MAIQHRLARARLTPSGARPSNTVWRAPVQHHGFHTMFSTPRHLPILTVGTRLSTCRRPAKCGLVQVSHLQLWAPCLRLSLAHSADALQVVDVGTAGRACTVATPAPAGNGREQVRATVSRRGVEVWEVWAGGMEAWKRETYACTAPRSSRTAQATASGMR
eukprot:363770-Chlamydomonas_euryale.AAC.4